MLISNESFGVTHNFLLMIRVFKLKAREAVFNCRVTSTNKKVDITNKFEDLEYARNFQ